MNFISCVKHCTCGQFDMGLKCELKPLCNDDNNDDCVCNVGCTSRCERLTVGPGLFSSLAKPSPLHRQHWLTVVGLDCVHWGSL